MFRCCCTHTKPDVCLYIKPILNYTCVCVQCTIKRKTSLTSFYYSRHFYVGDMNNETMNTDLLFSLSMTWRTLPNLKVRCRYSVHDNGTKERQTWTYLFYKSSRKCLLRIWYLQWSVSPTTPTRSAVCLALDRYAAHEGRRTRNHRR